MDRLVNALIKLLSALSCLKVRAEGFILLNRLKFLLDILNIDVKLVLHRPQIPLERMR